MTPTYFNANDFIFVIVKLNIFRDAGNGGPKYKLHLGVRFDRADVLVAFVAIQYETQVDVSTSTSVCLPVNSDSRSICAVDCSRHILQFYLQVIRKINNWH